MAAGRLDRRIIIERADLLLETTDAMGTPVPFWRDLVAVWADAKLVSDGERWQAGQTLADRLYRFTIRYSSEVANVDPRDRIQYDGRVWEIHGVKEVGRRQFLEITAAARAEAPA